MSCNCENKEELMKKIMSYRFAVIDMSLFLDTHPCDKKALELHNEYVRELKKAIEKYEKEYGPLCIETEMNSWKWVEDKWPWEKEVK